MDDALKTAVVGLVFLVIGGLFITTETPDIVSLGIVLVFLGVVLIIIGLVAKIISLSPNVSTKSH